HIQNVHVHEIPLFPECLHPPSTNQKWLTPVTRVTYRLEKVLSPLYQTSALEGFHSVILR
ncbi:hypothetical protein CRENBAI_013287, partial [Crenichthys baileyi]